MTAFLHVLYCSCFKVTIVFIPAIHQFDSSPQSKVMARIAQPPPPLCLASRKTYEASNEDYYEVEPPVVTQSETVPSHYTEPRPDLLKVQQISEEMYNPLHPTCNEPGLPYQALLTTLEYQNIYSETIKSKQPNYPDYCEVAAHEPREYEPTPHLYLEIIS